MSMEISLAIIAIGFTFLIFGLLGFLMYASNCLRKIEKSLEMEITPLLNEATATVKSISDITSTVKDKLQLTDPLFHSISKVGHITGTFLSDTHKSMETVKALHNNHEKFYGKKKFGFNDWMELAGLAIVLWQKFKKRKEK